MTLKKYLIAALLSSVCMSSSMPAQSQDNPGFLFVNATVTDFEKLGVYGRALPSVYAKFDASYRIVGGIGRDITVLEGSSVHQSLIFVEFKSLDDIESFWWSEDYRKITPLRDGAGQFDVIGIEGTGLEPYEARDGIQPAYVFTTIKVNDRDKAMAYVEATMELTQNAPGRVIALARPNDYKVLEGPAPNFTIEISSWPSVSAFEEYLSNPKYIAAIPNRDAAMDLTIMIAEVPKPQP